MKEKINIELSKDLWIYVEGIYFKDENPEYFQIDKIEMYRGSILDLLNWFEGKEIMNIEEIILENLENN